MPLSPLAGKPAPADLLINVERRVSALENHTPAAMPWAHQSSPCGASAKIRPGLRI